MLGNLINIHDFGRLLREINEHGIRKLLAKLRGGTSRVQESWKHIEREPSNWWDVKEVVDRWDRIITGCKNKPFRDYVVEKYLSNPKQVQALSLGCGTGSKELEWVKTGAIHSLEGYDISPTRIGHANERSAAMGYGEKAKFFVANVAGLSLDRQFDLILFEDSLHHFSPIRNILQKVKTWLADDGILVVKDFVGPSRFQWTDNQLDAVNSALALLPEKYARLRTGRIKRKIHRPGGLAMYLNDPSEAAESSLILPTITTLFTIVEHKDLGGSLLHLVLKDIARNFAPEDEESKEVIRMLFTLEDDLLTTGRLQSDFAFLVCRKGW